MIRHTSVVLSLGALALAISGCSVSSTNSGAGGGSDDGSPVKAQPLAGTIAGQTFTAKTAVRDGSGFVNVYDFDTTCADFAQPKDGDVGILLTPSSWADGSAYELSSSSSLTFVKYPAQNYISASGRVEIVSAGDATTPGTLRIRASTDSSQVEGEVPVLNCTGQ